MSQVSMLETAGELVALDSELGWVTRLLDEGTVGLLQQRPGVATVAIHIESSTSPFSTGGFSALTRGAWSRPGEVVVEDACGSGFDLHVGLTGLCPEFSFRWRPSLTRSGVRYLMPTRFHLLTRATLIQYPVLWMASVRGRAPLHAVACTAGDGVVLLAGPGGIGKSTLLQGELAAGGIATSDNLCVGDGRTVWGLVEPMRVVGGQGRRVTHGRVEIALDRRVDKLAPDHVVVVCRSDGESSLLKTCDPETAARSLVTGTYAAGELRRFWAFAATLAAGSGLGPAHPSVSEAARAFALRLRCHQLFLPRRPGPRLSEMLSRIEAIA